MLNIMIILFLYYKICYINFKLCLIFLFKRTLNFVDLIFRLYFNISYDTTCNIWAYLKKDLEINLDLTIILIIIATVYCC